MMLQDLATPDYIFQKIPESENSGKLTCRHCGKEVLIKIKSSSFLFFATSKVKVLGNWCKCTKIENILQNLIREGTD